MATFYFIICIFVIFCVFGATGFPSYIEKCHQSDPNFQLCCTRALNEVKSHFLNGISDFYLPPVDPFIIPKFSLTSKDLTTTLTNLELYHLEQLQIKNLNVNLNDDEIKINLLIPLLELKSLYNIKGKFLLFQLDGNGLFQGNLTDIDVEIILKGQRYQKLDEDYIKFSEFKMDFNHNQINVNFKNIFRNNDEITNEINQILNENIHEILNDYKPAIEVGIGQLITGMIERIFEKYSVEDLFPK